MKKLVLLSLTFVLVLAVGCNQKKSSPDNLQNIELNDSLKSIILERDNQINDMMATMNEIQDGFNEINEAESRVSLIKGNERVNKSKQIKEDIRFIADRMQQNRALIKKLQDQLKNSNFRGSEMKKVISNMLKQLDEKDQQLQQLRAELEAKNIHIAELDETIEGLNSNVSNLQSENAQKAETINSQDVQLNTAWYVYGTKKELKDQRILVDGKVLQSSFNKNYFMKIDIRVTKEIKLYSKSVKLLTTHPSGSYQLVTDENKQYVLQITTPQLFWSTSKYLVVLVK
jgi:hypothetical protein